MTYDEFNSLLAKIQAQELKVRADGHKEYAHDSDTFVNFHRVGSMVSCPHCQQAIGPQAALMVYLLKHIDGILSYVGGHRSQRESITGRIKDARMYLALLWGMVEMVDEEKKEAEAIMSNITARVNEIVDDWFISDLPSNPNQSLIDSAAESDSLPVSNSLTYLCSCAVPGKITDEKMPYIDTIAPCGLTGWLADQNCELCKGNGRVKRTDPCTQMQS